MQSSDPHGAALALVTGAGSGIGAATAEALGAAGWRVICAGRRRQPLAATVGRIGTDQAIGIELDVTDLASVQGLTRRLPRGWREIEVLVNAAGHDVGGRRALEECDPHALASIIETNITGLIWVTRHLIAGMRARRRGHVVNIGSVAGLRPYATGTAYSASKHAVHGFSECLRLECREGPLRVTEILPGMVRTEFAATRLGDRGAADRFYDEFGRCLDPEDVARAVLFALAQPDHVVISQLVVVPRAQS